MDEMIEKAFFASVRKEFPELLSDTASPAFTYLDNAASTLKPRSVIETLCRFYSSEYAPIHRSMYRAAREASQRYEAVRTTVKEFLNSASEEEVIFTKGATDSLNLIADLLARSGRLKDSTILLSHMEHHSNIIPWQLVGEREKASLLPIPLTSNDTLDLDFLEKELKKGHVSVVSLCHMSNVLGTINPISEIATLCHRYGALLSVDAAQSAPHMHLDVQALGCDFLSFSSHKMYGPTGVGVLWGRKELLETLSPTRGGGGMIDTVSFSQATYGPLPARFEPGTPAIAEVIGFGEALLFLRKIGLHRIAQWESALTSYTREQLTTIPGLLLIGNAQQRGPLQSFSFEKAHPLDVATLLDLRGIAVRSGHMCCQPLLRTLHTSSLLRISFGLYNSYEDCDHFLYSLHDVLQMILE